MVCTPATARSFAHLRLQDHTNTRPAQLDVMSSSFPFDCLLVAADAEVESPEALLIECVLQSQRSNRAVHTDARPIAKAATHYMARHIIETELNRIRQTVRKMFASSAPDESCKKARCRSWI